MAIGFLHTSPLHVTTFDVLVARLAPGERVLHRVEPELLADARTGGAGAVAEAVRTAVDELVALGADVVVCTCSTLGPVAEATGVAGEHGAGEVLRVDRPAALGAVEVARRGGGAVGAVVALASTVAPTRDLLVASGAPAVEVVLADGAWERFEAGDQVGYLRTVEQAVRGLAPRVAVVLLAQASMADVADLVGDLPVPVLATPQVAVEQAVAALAAGRGDRSG